VRWLASSFAFFCLGLCDGKNANVLANGLALNALSILCEIQLAEEKPCNEKTKDVFIL
jgi:hypothetical protein